MLNCCLIFLIKQPTQFDFSFKFINILLLFCIRLSSHFILPSRLPPCTEILFNEIVYVVLICYFFVHPSFV